MHATRTFNTYVLGSDVIGAFGMSSAGPVAPALPIPTPAPAAPTPTPAASGMFAGIPPWKLAVGVGGVALLLSGLTLALVRR